MAYHLEFEKPVIDIESKIDEIKQIYNKEGGDVLLSDIKKLERRISRLRKNIFCKLSPWQKTQVARHPVGRISDVGDAGQDVTLSQNVRSVNGHGRHRGCCCCFTSKSIVCHHQEVSTL